MGQINLKKTDLPNTPGTGRTGIYIDSTNAPILILEDGSEIPLGGTTLEQIYIDAINGGQNPSSENPFVTLEQLNSTVSGGVNSIVFGGAIQWSGTGLVFDSSASGYIIQGVYYEVIADTLTLTTADATNDRRDRFKLTVSGWDFNTGTPAAVPVAPTVNEITEIDRGDVLIEALATTPTITNIDVYLENTEWTTSSGGTGTFNPDSTTDPFAGTKAFEATSIQAGGFMLFTNSIDINVSDIESIGLQLKLKATMNNGRYLRVQFFDSLDNQVSRNITLPIVKNNSTTYQFVGVEKSNLGFVASAFRKIKISYLGTGGATTYSGYFIDNVILQSGISQGSNPILTQDEINAIKQSNDPTSLNPFATIADISISSGVQTVTGTGVDNTDPVNPIINLNSDFTASSFPVAFDIPRKYGFTMAITGNITFGITGAFESSMAKILHNDTVAPTITGTGGVTVVNDGGTYVVSVDNIIYLVCHKNDAGTVTKVSYTITQNQP